MHGPKFKSQYNISKKKNSTEYYMLFEFLNKACQTTDLATMHSKDINRNPIKSDNIV